MVNVLVNDLGTIIIVLGGNRLKDTALENYGGIKP